MQTSPETFVGVELSDQASDGESQNEADENKVSVQEGTLSETTRTINNFDAEHSGARPNQADEDARLKKDELKGLSLAWRKLFDGIANTDFDYRFHNGAVKLRL